jgi:ArsR family transcriptional regulator, arsenate/arsenite/antimonite-responsive transcriptional repressor
MAKYSVGMREVIRITKALADPSRLRVLLALQQAELCVCQVGELLQLAPSTVSKHLSLLHTAGLIESRKDERWVFYRLPDRAVSVAAREAIGWVRKSLAATAEARADRRRLNQILRMNPSILCRRQARR